jgi:hypothetical protein
MSDQEQANIAETAVTDTDIVTKAGAPFKTEQAAVMTAEAKGISDSHTPVNIGERQWVLRKNDGAPEVSSEEVKSDEPSFKPEVSKKKFYRIKILEQGGPDGSGDVFITDASNGRPYLIQRNQEVEVPEGLYNNLIESVITRVEKDSSGEERERNVPRYAMQLLGEVYK